MRKNISPWVSQLNEQREERVLTGDIQVDVAIVGAGIAGIASAYFTLTKTDKSVVLLERFKLARGATGHNAGQVVSYFEKGFAAMVEEFGPLLAAQGQKNVDDAWELLDEMYSTAGLDIPFSRFVGHGGLTSKEQVLWNLKNNHAKRTAGLNPLPLKVAADAGVVEDIPKDYEGLYEVVPRATVLELLETSVTDYIAVISSHKGCLNSALFCQEVVTFLLKEYADRFALYEHTPVHKILLRGGHAVLDADTHTVTAQRAVLCTNGFEDLHIINESGLDIDARYHHLLSGKIGYMSGYLEKMNKPPIAISYYSDPVAGMDNSYFYLTRRPFEYEQGTQHNLVSIGGPDVDLEETRSYSHEDDYPDEMAEKIDDFVHTVYALEPNRKIEYVYTWHGLMGYTRNGIRLVGEEPQNPTLLYNLGCNGVGILHAIYGGQKIARHIAGEVVEKTIFDVPVRDISR